MRSSLILVAALALSSTARGDIQKGVPEEWPGKNELSAHVGWEAGLVGFNQGGTPGGFRVMGEYAFRFHRLMWLDFGASFVVGVGNCDATGVVCGAGGGANVFEPQAGIKVKWQTPIPLVPYGRFVAVVPIVWGRFCGDNGVAIGARAAGGAKYFLTKNIGVGAEMGLLFGPGFFSGGNCSNAASHVEIYGAFDFNVGGEFIF